MRLLVFICFASAASAQYNYESGVSNNGPLAGSSSPIASQPGEEEYNKAFYTYSAPEEEFEDLNANEQVANVLKRNLRVIFIKSPENTALENAVLQLARGTADDRIAIYVLSKQSDIGSLVNATNSPGKPEVHFVKYRTQADADTAQRAIQAQYEGFRGSSSSNSPGSASVLDFTSKSASPSTINNSLAPTSSATTTSAPSRSFLSKRNTYLPPSKRY